MHKIRDKIKDAVQYLTYSFSSSASGTLPSQDSVQTLTSEHSAIPVDIATIVTEVNGSCEDTFPDQTDQTMATQNRNLGSNNKGYQPPLNSTGTHARNFQTLFAQQLFAEVQEALWQMCKSCDQKLSIMEKTHAQEMGKLVKEKSDAEKKIADFTKKIHGLEEERRDKIAKLKAFQENQLESASIGNKRPLPSTSNIGNSFQDLGKKIKNHTVSALRGIKLHDHRIEELFQDELFLDQIQRIMVDPEISIKKEDVREILREAEKSSSREAKDVINFMIQGVIHNMLYTNIINSAFSGLSEEEMRVIDKIYTAIAASKGQKGQDTKAAREWRAMTQQRLLYWAKPQNLDHDQDDFGDIKTITETFQYAKFGTVANICRVLGPLYSDRPENNSLRDDVKGIVDAAVDFSIKLQSQVSHYRLERPAKDSFESLPEYQDETPPNTQPYFYISHTLLKSSDEEGEDFDPEIIIKGMIFSKRLPNKKTINAAVEHLPKGTAISGFTKIETENEWEASKNGTYMPGEYKSLLDGEAEIDPGNDSKNNISRQNIGQGADNLLKEITFIELAATIDSKEVTGPNGNNPVDSSQSTLIKKREITPGMPTAGADDEERTLTMKIVLGQEPVVFGPPLIQQETKMMDTQFQSKFPSEVSKLSMTTGRQQSQKEDRSKNPPLTVAVTHPPPISPKQDLSREILTKTNNPQPQEEDLKMLSNLSASPNQVDVKMDHIETSTAAKMTTTPPHPQEDLIKDQQTAQPVLVLRAHKTQPESQKMSSSPALQTKDLTLHIIQKPNPQECMETPPSSLESCLAVPETLPSSQAKVEGWLNIAPEVAKIMPKQAS